MLPIILLIAGLAFLWFGSDVVVEGVRKLAEKYGISPGIIGLSVISIGTSLPEIFTNIQSALMISNGVDASGIGIGTVIGSCLVQITLITGVIALIGTLHASKQNIRVDGMMVLISIILLFLAGFDGRITRFEGTALILGYGVYLVFLAKRDHIMEKTLLHLEGKSNKKQINIEKNIAFVVAGLALLTIGGKLVVTNAVIIAEQLHVSSSLIGILVIGIGSGLPEFSTAVKATMRNVSSLSIGTLIGSNITDPMLSLGLGTVISDFTFPRHLLFFDIPYWFVATALTLFLLSKKQKVGKKDHTIGTVLISMFFLYVVLKLWLFT